MLSWDKGSKPFEKLLARCESGVVKQQNETENEPVPITGLRAATAVARDRGISVVTLWRWRSRNWIKSANISGKTYIDLKSLADFDRRAAAGEFAQKPAGAAGASIKARTQKEVE